MMSSLRPAGAALAVAACVLLTRPAPADEPPKKAEAAAPEADAPIYDPDALGEKTIAFYQKAASESGRRLLLNLGTNDCEPCRVYNRAIHEEKFFRAFIQQFVPANVDVANMPNAALVDRYLINPKAPLPAILIFMPDGRLIEALAHGEMAAIAKKGDDAVREWLVGRFAKTSD